MSFDSESLPTPDGSTTACRCGAPPHPKLADRCEVGHVMKSNMTAFLTGERSVQFWHEHAAARREMAEEIIRDAGFALKDAPRALRLVVESAAQAVLVRDSAYERMVEAGGALSSAGNARRCFNVWLAASDRLDRALRLVGLERKARPVDPMTALGIAVERANREPGE